MCQWKRESQGTTEGKEQLFFAFYVSSVINSKFYKVLMGYNFQKRRGLEF